ncbi:MAG TPA: glucose 1-dehydrogenase [Rhizomicrobium sp.]|nr:glucose 1-dehydrogenase [Rhizomicrobium sp.]
MEQGALKGKVAIVTGSATGIGAGAALALAKAGAKVVVNYSKSEAEAKGTVDAVKKAGGEALLVQGNVASDADCRKIADAALQSWGRIDILVNNAGTTKFASHEDLAALTAEDFAQIYAVNVIGPFQMIRAAAPALKKSGAGAVVNVSSVAGLSGVGSSVAYAASKGALNTMTLSLARALGPEIRVNAICPGYVATRWFVDRFGQERTDKISETQADTTPLKRAGMPDDIADAILFFCLPLSRHITGEFLAVDAGLHLSLPRMR